MIRKYIAIVVIGIAVSSAASAQSNQSTTAPSSTTKASGWLTHEQPGQWRASKLKGLDVYSDQNQKIGDINELIVDAFWQNRRRGHRRRRVPSGSANMTLRYLSAIFRGLRPPQVRPGRRTSQFQIVRLCA